MAGALTVFLTAERVESAVHLSMLIKTGHLLTIKGSGLFLLCFLI